MQQPGNRPGAFRLRVAISAMTLAIWAVATIPAAADDAVETRQLVEKARFTVENFMRDPTWRHFGT